MYVLTPSQFPPLLREISDPPAKLYLEGTLPNPESFLYLTVVGSRHYTSYGGKACEEIISGLRGYPIVIVSGLAIGIDGIAHESALRAELKTVAIPGSGLDRTVLYPRSHLALAERILTKGGALISEYEPLTPAAPYTFPRRNRIMSGISHAILVIEAGEKSGTLITARLALDYNRDVYAVPGSIFSENSIGSNRLIQDGAAPICSSDDLLFELELKREISETSSIKNEDNISPEEKRILRILIEPLSRDELIKASGMETSQINVILVRMELQGFIREQDGLYTIS